MEPYVKSWILLNDIFGADAGRETASSFFAESEYI